MLGDLDRHQFRVVPDQPGRVPLGQQRGQERGLAAGPGAEVEPDTPVGAGGRGGRRPQRDHQRDHEENLAARSSGAPRSTAATGESTPGLA